MIVGAATASATITAVTSFNDCTLMIFVCKITAYIIRYTTLPTKHAVKFRDNDFLPCISDSPIIKQASPTTTIPVPALISLVLLNCPTSAPLNPTSILAMTSPSVIIFLTVTLDAVTIARLSPVARKDTVVCFKSDIWLDHPMTNRLTVYSPVLVMIPEIMEGTPMRVCKKAVI